MPPPRRTPNWQCSTAHAWPRRRNGGVAVCDHLLACVAYVSHKRGMSVVERNVRSVQHGGVRARLVAFDQELAGPRLNARKLRAERHGLAVECLALHARASKASHSRIMSAQPLLHCVAMFLSLPRAQRYGGIGLRKRAVPTICGDRVTRLQHLCAVRFAAERCGCVPRPDHIANAQPCRVSSRSKYAMMLTEQNDT